MVAALLFLSLTFAAVAEAHRGDGIFRLAEGRWLEVNRTGNDVAMLSDGSVIVVGEELAWRIALDGRRSLIRGFAGTGVTATADGGALAIQGATDESVSVPLGQHRILRWTPASGVSVVAGTGSPGLSGDGGPASGALLNLGPSRFAMPPGFWADYPASPTGIIATAHGGFVFTDTGNGRIRAVDAAGNIRTIAGASTGTFRDPVGLAATPDGSYLVSENGWPEFGRRGLPGRLLRLRPDGTIETLQPSWAPTDIAVSTDGTAVLPEGWHLPSGSRTPQRYLPEPESEFTPFDFAARSYPGGWKVAFGPSDDLLTADDRVVAYRPAGPTPWTLTALRLTRPNRHGVTAPIETTQSGTATLEIADDQRVVARVTQAVGAGHSTLYAAGPIRDTWYDVRLKLEGATGRIARDRVPIHGARALTVQIARKILGRYQGPSGDTAARYRLGRHCLRFGQRRVDCQIDINERPGRSPRSLVGVASLTLERSGVVLRRDYDWSRRGFQLHPRFNDQAGLRRLSRGHGGKWLDY
jgi:hypothetical protein